MIFPNFLEYFGKIRNILENFGIFWNNLEYIEKVWNFLEKLGIFWKSLELFGILSNFFEFYGLLMKLRLRGQKYESFLLSIVSFAIVFFSALLLIFVRTREVHHKVSFEEILSTFSYLSV